MLKKSLSCTLLVCAGLITPPASFALPMLSAKDRTSTEQAAKAGYSTVMTNAYAAISAKKLAEAQKLFQEAARLEPKLIEPWLGLSEAARLGNDIKAAEAAIRKAAEIGPSKIEPVVALARLEYARKAYPEAEKLWQKAIKLDPKSPTPLVDLGDYYSGAGKDVTKATNYYRQATQVAPSHSGAHYALGMMLLAQGDALSATTEFEAAQKFVSGNNPLPALALGRVYSQNKKWKDAEWAFSQAIAIQPKLTEAYIGRAMAYGQAGNRANALADLKQAEAIDAKNAEASFRIGMIHQESSQWKEAYAAYERAIAIDPKFVVAYNNLAWMAATRKERLDQALTWSKKALELAPKEAELFDTRAWVLRAKGDLDGAILALNEGIALRPSANLHYHLGVIQSEKKMTEAAKASLRKALQIAPDFADARDAKQLLRQLDSTPGK